MRITFLFSLTFLFFANIMSAQNVEKTAQKVAKTLCSCMGQEFKKLDAEGVSMMLTMLKKEREVPGSGTAYLESLSQEQQMRMVQAMGALGENEGMEKCMDKSGLEKEVKKLGDQITAGELLEKSTVYMKKIKGCELVYEIMSMAAESQNE